MARVVVTEAARKDLESLITSHRLGSDTRARVRRSLHSLKSFPLLGAELDGAFKGRRFVLGPWRWMIIVYSVSEDMDLVAVLSIIDGRTSSSPTASW